MGAREGIEHVVVLMLENRSFDCMLGALYPKSAGFEGLSGAETNPWLDAPLHFRLSAQLQLHRAALLHQHRSGPHPERPAPAAPPNQMQKSLCDMASHLPPTAAVSAAHAAAGYAIGKARAFFGMK